MALPHPRTQTIAIFAICVVVVLAVSVFSGSLQGKTDTMNQNYLATNSFATSTPAVSAELLNSTSTDWQKAFTNSDFITQSNKDVYASASSASDTENLSLTDKFGRQFFMNYMTLKQSGGINSSSSIDIATAQLATVGLDAAQPKLYTLKNISVINQNDTATLRAYSNSVEEITSLYNFPRNEAVITKDAAAVKSVTTLTEIDPIIAAYTKIVSRLLDTPAPMSLQQDHLDLINGFSTMKFVAESLRDSEKDPLKGIIGTNTYLQGVGQIIESLRSLRDDLGQSGISFEPDQGMLVTLLNIQTQ